MKKLLLVSVFALFALININSVQAVAGVSSITSDLRYGMTNNVQVRALQQILINEGFMTGVPTGNFFNMTIQAVKKFQAAHSVEATGFVGVITRNYLDPCAGTLTANDASCNGGNNGGGGGSGSGQTPPPSTAVTLTANDSRGPITILSGSAVRLKWTSTNMQNCWGDGFISTATSNQVGVVVNPTASKTYSINCTPVSGVGGTSSVVVNVGSTPPPPQEPVSTTFTAGDNIKTTDVVRVRSSAGITSYDNSLGSQQLGAKGTIVANASNGTKSGDYYWWNVNFDSGVDGWVAEAYITKDTTTEPNTPTPPTSTPTSNCQEDWKLNGICRKPEVSLSVDPGWYAGSNVVENGAQSALIFNAKYATTCLMNGDSVFNRGLAGPLGLQWANQPITMNGRIQMAPGDLSHLPRTFTYSCTGPGGTAENKVTYIDVASTAQTCKIDYWNAESFWNSAWRRIEWRVNATVDNSCTGAMLQGWDYNNPNESVALSIPSGTVNIGKSDVVRRLTLRVFQGAHGVVETQTKTLQIYSGPSLEPTTRTAVPAGSTGATTSSEKLLFQALGRDALYKIVHNSTSNSLLLKKIQSGKETWSQSYVSNAGNLAQMCLKMVDDNDPHRFLNPPNLSVIPYLTNIFAPIFINSCTSVAAGVYGTLEIVGSGSGSSSSSSGSSSGGGSGGGGSSSDSVTGSQYQN